LSNIKRQKSLKNAAIKELISINQTEKMSFTVKALTLVVLLGMAGGIGKASAQQLAVKTNLLYDATTTPNLGVELCVGQKHSMQLYYGLNPWKFNTDNGKKFFKHWMLAPEYRYWFCHRFQGSFVGVHGLGGEFNAANVKLPFGMYKGLRDHRYECWYIGGGVSYGYQCVLSRHWNFEASIGAGVVYAKYKGFGCGEYGSQVSDGDTWYVGPTKAVLSILYMF
jgi:hypothetical protein